MSERPVFEIDSEQIAQGLAQLQLPGHDVRTEHSPLLTATGQAYVVPTQSPPEYAPPMFATGTQGMSERIPAPSSKEEVSSESSSTPASQQETVEVPSKMRTKPVSTTPKWEKNTKERIREAIKKFRLPLAELVARDANEGDTRLLVTDMLCDALGFDKYEDLTTEYLVKGEFADYGLRINRQLVAFVEVKRCSQKLNERHLRQVTTYAMNEGVEWIFLTNGQHWETYHLTGGLPISIEKVDSIDLLDAEEHWQKKVEKFFAISKEGISHKVLDTLWRSKLATSPSALKESLLSEGVLDALRKEIKRKSGHKIDNDDIRQLLIDEVFIPSIK